MVMLDGSGLRDLKNPKTGKVREVYDLGDQLLFVATDRISAFDVIMANGIPDKGQVLTQMSWFWFQRLAKIVPHHAVSVDPAQIQNLCPHDGPILAGRSMIVQKARPLPIECVVRGYLAGSGWKEYRQSRSVCGVSLPEGLEDGSLLPEPIFTPATKAETGHDENITWKQACDLVGVEVAERVRAASLDLYAAARDHARTCGLILADTKFEFGLTDDGVIWIDEALTPDSSRYWEADMYCPGGPQPSFDKQFVRDYLEGLDWNKQPPGPTLPEDVVNKTREKYLAALEKITGQPLHVLAV